MITVVFVLTTVSVLSHLEDLLWQRRQLARAELAELVAELTELRHRLPHRHWP